MDGKSISQILTWLNSGAHHIGDAWVRGQCPLAPWNHKGGVDMHPSFGVRIEPSGESYAACFSCGFKGNLQDLIFRIAHLNRSAYHPGMQIKLARELAEQDGDTVILQPVDYDQAFSALVQAHTTSRIPEEWLSTFPRARLFPVAMSYLQGRGIPAPQVKQFDIRYDLLRERVCFPIRDQDGKLCMLQGRTIHPGIEPRYYMYPHDCRSVHHWFNEDRADLGKPLVIVEGCFDAVSVAKLYPNVIAGLTATPSKHKMNLLTDAVRIVTLFDAGQGGNSARERMSKFGAFQGISVEHLIPSEDPNSIPLSELEQLLDAAHLM